MSWRGRLVSLHRDLGFVALGLTVVYAVSGIATNHRAHWDYNYSTETTTVHIGDARALLGAAPDADIGALTASRKGDLVAAVGRAFGRTAPPRKAFFRGPDRLSLFYAEGERDVIDYAPQKGIAEWTRKTPRPVLRVFNMLHLNENRSVWTWIADAFAAILLFLAVSGVVVVRGRRGLAGRGGMLVVAGILIPFLLMVLLG